jgi:hypothetical protein
VAEPARLVLGRDHALDERLTGALVGAVGRIGREGDVDLVRDVEAHHQRVRPEAAHHLPHVPCPGGDVALLRLAGLVAHLELDRVVVTRVVLRESQELLEPGLTVAPEESRQPERERRVRTAQLLQLRQMPGRILGHRRRGRRPYLPGHGPGVDPEPDQRTGVPRNLRRVRLADAAGRARLRGPGGRRQPDDDARQAQRTEHEARRPGGRIAHPGNVPGASAAAVR